MSDSGGRIIGAVALNAGSVGIGSIISNNTVSLNTPAPSQMSLTINASGAGSVGISGSPVTIQQGQTTSSAFAISGVTAGQVQISTSNGDISATSITVG